MVPGKMKDNANAPTPSHKTREKVTAGTMMVRHHGAQRTMQKCQQQATKQWKNCRGDNFGVSWGVSMRPKTLFLQRKLVQEEFLRIMHVGCVFAVGWWLYDEVFGVGPASSAENGKKEKQFCSGELTAISHILGFCVTFYYHRSAPRRSSSVLPKLAVYLDEVSKCFP
jgi:hypothetical protein